MQGRDDRFQQNGRAASDAGNALEEAVEFKQESHQHHGRDDNRSVGMDGSGDMNVVSEQANLAQADVPAMDLRYLDPAFLDEHDLIQRYLHNCLGDDELRALECAIIANPALIDLIEQQRLINAAYRARAADLQPAPTRQAAWRGALSIAACLVLGIFVLQRMPVTAPGSVQAETQSELVLQTLRGREQVHTVRAGADLPLRIDVGPPVAGERYRLRLIDEQSGRESLRRDNLSADADGWLLSVLRAGTAQGEQLLEITSMNGNRVQRYRIDFQ